MYRIPDRLAFLTLMFVLAVIFMGNRPEGIQGQGLTTLPTSQPANMTATPPPPANLTATPPPPINMTAPPPPTKNGGGKKGGGKKGGKKKTKATSPPNNMTATPPPPANLTVTPPPPINMTAPPPPTKNGVGKKGGKKKKTKATSPPTNMTTTRPPPANMTATPPPPINMTTTPPPPTKKGGGKKGGGKKGGKKKTKPPPPPTNMTTTPQPPANMTATTPPPSNMTTTLPPPTNTTTKSTTTTRKKRRRMTTTKRPTTTTTTPTTTTAIPLICKYGSCKPDGHWPRLELMMMEFEAEFRILHRRGLVDDNGDALPSGPCDVAQAPRENRSTRRQAQLDYYTNQYLNLISINSDGYIRYISFPRRFKNFVKTIRKEERLFCRTQLGLSCITDPGSPGMEPYCGCTPPVYIPSPWNKPVHLVGTSLINQSCSIQFSHPCDVCVPDKTNTDGYQLDFTVPCSRVPTNGTVFFYSGYNRAKDYCAEGSTCVLETYGDLPTVKDPVKNGRYCIKNGTKSRVEQLIDPTSKQSKPTGSTVVLIYTLLLNLAYRSWCHSRNHLHRHTRNPVLDSTFCLLHNFKHRRKFLPKNPNLQPDISQLA